MCKNSLSFWMWLPHPQWREGKQNHPQHLDGSPLPAWVSWTCHSFVPSQQSHNLSWTWSSRTPWIPSILFWVDCEAILILFFFFFHLQRFVSVSRAVLAWAKELFPPSLAQFPLKMGSEIGSYWIMVVNLQGWRQMEPKEVKFLPRAGIVSGDVGWGLFLFFVCFQKMWEGSQQGRAAPGSCSAGWTFLLELILNKRHPKLL